MGSDAGNILLGKVRLTYCASIPLDLEQWFAEFLEFLWDRTVFLFPGFPTV